MPQLALTRSDLDTFMDALRGFHTACRGCLARPEPRDPFCNSMGGQCSPRARTSIDPMAGQVAGGKVRAMQRLVSDALWEEAGMRETSHRMLQDEMGEPDGGLLIAETGCAKHGQASVGVARPYGGSLARWSTVRWASVPPRRRGTARRWSTHGCSGRSHGAPTPLQRGGRKGRGQTRWRGSASPTWPRRWCRTSPAPAGSPANILAQMVSRGTAQTAGRPAPPVSAPSLVWPRRRTRGVGSSPWPRPRLPIMRKASSAPSGERRRQPQRRARSPHWPRRSPRPSGSAAPCPRGPQAPAPTSAPANGSGGARRGTPRRPCGGSATGHSAPIRGTGTLSATPRCVPRDACACGAVACGGRSNRASRRRKRRWGWTPMPSGSLRAGIIIGARVCGPTAFSGIFSSGWKKKAPALTPTATFIFDLRSASPYASPAYPIYSKETAYVTSLSDRR